MTDTISKEKRSWNMSRIKNKDTKPELIVRSILHCMGYRFRLHRKDLPGKPDIVLPKYKTAIFVNGCFWHRHKNCKFAYMPKTRKEFWQKKFNDTVKRDKTKKAELKKLGWKIIIIWECEIVKRNMIKSLLKKELCQ
ncbi:MAG: DNA mismatch endonuclease Vsr [Phycisphaerae bacterium]|nr:DNA mismatch endonuclease Vsr [Phycisphaerae bacterium]